LRNPIDFSYRLKQTSGTFYNRVEVIKLYGWNMSLLITKHS